MMRFFDLMGPAAELPPHDSLLVDAFWMGVASARESEYRTRAEGAFNEKMRAMYLSIADEKLEDAKEAASSLRRWLDERAQRKVTI